MVAQLDSLFTEYTSPSQTNFAVLDLLENLRQVELLRDKGKLSLKLVWPGSTHSSIIWKQSTNPFSDGGEVAGFDWMEPNECQK